MKISIQITIDHENGDPTVTKPITEFRRDNLASNTLGLTIKESKILLENVQTEFVQQQVDQHICEHRKCNHDVATVFRTNFHPHFCIFS